MSEEEQQQNQSQGWWGSTLGKLKSALARTKSAVVDSVLDKDAQEEPEEKAPVAPQSQYTDVSSSPTAKPVGEQSGETYPRNEQPAEAYTAAMEQSVATASVQHAESYSRQTEAYVQSSETSFPQSQPVMTAPPAPSTAAPSRAPHQATRAKAVEIDDDYLENLEEKLIRADLGLATAETLVTDLRKEARAKNWNSWDVENFLKKEFTSMLGAARESALKMEPGKLNIYLVVGVNGTGKTTSIGKLCWRFKTEGKKVLMAAADTFRAAAESQLEIWSERAQVEIVRLADGSDPGAVVYQALQKGKDEGFDALVIDTAGRLHNKANLMAELKKVRGVIEKNAQGLPLESLLVLDASTGQNGLQQAKVFTEVCPLTGVILTKLDGTAKGGVVFSITRELKIPVKLIGLGEKIDDLRDFEPDLFVEALFD